MVQLRPKYVIREPLPPLLVSDYHTMSYAIHRITFTGPLRDFDKGNLWSKKVIDHALSSRDIHEERYELGDETRLQDRFNQWIGQVVADILEARKFPVRFGDFKASGVCYGLIPDSVLLATNPLDPEKLKAVGN
ncbi:hypothetical protein N7495_004207 [Penicillium taxi]|uniref:uncharacterized protein n=1 Tax=Penicillium taxi TaxID=168475 RepID=UPI00254501A3|nr:uncharacterized protein N7495_004207 [Penicillium taxi]KAJ5899463.1 hypothetical protein N7495_004207 [Penicillium taxi]